MTQPDPHPRIQELLDQRDELRAKIAAQEASARHREGRVAELLTEGNELKQRLSALDAMNENQAKTIIELQEKVAKLQAGMPDADLPGKLLDAQARIKKLESEVDESTSLMENWEQRFEALHKAEASLRQENESLRTSKTVLEDLYEKSQTALSETQGHLRATEAKLTEAVADAQTAKANLREAEHELKQSVFDNAGRQATIDAFRAKFGGLGSDQDTVARLRDQLRESEDQLSKVRRHRDSLKARLDNIVSVTESGAVALDVDSKIEVRGEVLTVAKTNLYSGRNGYRRILLEADNGTEQ